MTKHLFCLLAAVIVAASTTSTVCAAGPDEARKSATVCTAGPDEAFKSARVWLDIADKGDVTTAWEQTSAVFKGLVSASEWEKFLAKARGLFGVVGSRKLLSLEVTTSLPGAPDGEYVVLRFQTEFANKKEAIETITQHKDKDGIWRTAGYYIK